MFLAIQRENRFRLAVLGGGVRVKHNLLARICVDRAGERSSVEVHVEANGEVQFNVNLATLFLICRPMVIIVTQATSV